MASERIVGPGFLWRYPLHAVTSFFAASGWKLWAWGFVLHLRGKRGLMIAFIKKERVHDLP